ncbi:MAG: tetratricopeptide repeat protein [Phycisphaerae bacterium]|nr:tetratricopeptide repeat protein [Phycisphaerae bacterium]
MNEVSAASAEDKPISLGPEGEEQYALLRTGLELGSGFELSFVACDSPLALQEVARRLDEAPPSGCALYRLTFASPDDKRAIVERLISLPSSPADRWIVWISCQGLDDEAHAGWAQAFVTLNERRNLVVRDCPHALLFAGPTWLPVVAHNVAPDIWSIRSSVYALPSVVSTTDDEWARPETRPLWDVMEHELAVGEHYEALAKALELSTHPAEQMTRARLLRQAARAWSLRGEPKRALNTLEVALAIAEKRGDDHSRAITLGDIARLRAAKGEVDAALQLHQEELAVYEALGDKRSRAGTLGDIARLRADKGEVDAALQLHQEALAVYEALGDKRSRAVTLGDIARLRAIKGEVDAALQLHQERLAVYEALGDKRSRAVTLGDIARLRSAKGEVDAALQLHQERMAVYEALEDKRSRAVTLGDIARLRAAKGEVDAALQLHQEELAVYEALGDKRSRAVTLGNIARLRAVKGEVDAALQLHQERMDVYEALGDPNGIANTLWSIARIEIEQRKFNEADEHLTKSYEINLKLGHLEGICMVGLDFGPLLCATGRRDTGLEILTRSRDGFQTLGRPELAAQVQALLDQIAQSPPQPPAAPGDRSPAHPSKS